MHFAVRATQISVYREHIPAMGRRCQGQTTSFLVPNAFLGLKNKRAFRENQDPDNNIDDEMQMVGKYGIAEAFRQILEKCENHSFRKYQKKCSLFEPAERFIKAICQHGSIKTHQIHVRHIHGDSSNRDD